jgi:hypothetical protein
MFFKANKTVIYATIGLALASMGSAAVADVLVTRSSGAAARQYPRGTRLGDDQVIVLGRGDSVTILTSRGTRRYSQPGRYPVDGPRLRASNSVGVTSGSRGIARTGVSRTGTSLVPPPTAWQIDIDASGPFCIAEGQSVSFWRYSVDDSKTYTLTRLADNSSVTIAFGGGQRLSAWPSGFVPHNGTYRIEAADGSSSQEIVLTSLAVDLNDEVAVGQALLENGCDGQLDTFVRESTGDDGEAS